MNQYTARTNHGYLIMEGTSTNATVKLYETGSTEVTATRKDDYYFRDWDPDTASTASDYPEINVKEGDDDPEKRNAWIPEVSESSITYDDNGNLTADALWTYTYDEENRLIKMEETSAAATAGFPDTEITFKYDYLGRRVEKKVVKESTTETHLRFVWRGWLLVAELDASNNNAEEKTYTWGPDISGSFGGAGGNGGVLIFKDHTSGVNESFYPAYDAQGNVYGLIDTEGNLDAAYEYDPFGKLIRHAGDRKDSMSLLYGTKYTDMETGLIYYGYRYYDPRQGRFINRDPIGEDGGLNLYAMLGNSPVNRVDYLGLKWGWEWDPDCNLWEQTSYWEDAEGDDLLDSLGTMHIIGTEPGCLVRIWIDGPERDRDPNEDGDGTSGRGTDPPGKEEEPPPKKEKPWWCVLAKTVLAGNEKVGKFLSRVVGDDGNNLTAGGSIGGSVALPVLGGAGAGVHADVGAQLMFDWDDPLNSRFSFLLSGSAMFTGGGGIYMSAGPVAGNIEGEVESGISIQPHIHIEGAIATPGGGGALQVDFAIDPNARLGDQISDVVTGHSFSASPRGAIGVAGLVGVGAGGSLNAKIISPKEALQKKYNEECR